MTGTYYTILPAEVRLDKRLLPFERILFSDILTLANKNGYCFASNAYFAKAYEVSTVSISTWISNLVKYGYISRSYDYKDKTKKIERRRLYVRADFMTYKSRLNDPHKGDFKEGIKGDFKDNNINMNNIKDNMEHTTKVSIENPSRPPRKSDYLQAMLDRI
ncbi:helix-turn-helix domain-containing protein [uncultured Anaerococcus sp.]|uniref:helix-turn-helix domain-containing protein n=1 Tax=uncultured Anaerococcus sp. TaxID=293428 RepID=UPI00280BE18E|nr:helix-turn-helix domain-containing protein [uncultured Anaerococcus sp.]